MLAIQVNIELLPLWAQIVYVLAAALVTVFLVPYLKIKAEEAAASTRRLDAKAAESARYAQCMLIGQVREFLCMRAKCIVERQFPQIARSILTDGEMNKLDVKALLRNLGCSLKLEAFDVFKVQGTDLVEAMGDDHLDRLIEDVANEASPFPGRETAVELLKKEVAKWLVDEGVDWVRNKYLGVDAEVALENVRD